MSYASLALRIVSRLDQFNEFKRNKLHVSSAVIVAQEMFGYCGGLRAVSLFVNRSAMFVEAVFKSTFGFSYKWSK